jgi:hypothetical protein
MTKETDVRWLDEVALHKAVVAGDPEAFAELMRRFDPIVRAQLARVAREEAINEAMAGFWCGLITDDLARLRNWKPKLGGLLAQLVVGLAAQAARPLMKAVPPGGVVKAVADETPTAPQRPSHMK